MKGSYIAVPLALGTISIDWHQRTFTLDGLAHGAHPDPEPKEVLSFLQGARSNPEEERLAVVMWDEPAQLCIYDAAEFRENVWTDQVREEAAAARKAEHAPHVFLIQSAVHGLSLVYVNARLVCFRDGAANATAVELARDIATGLGIKVSPLEPAKVTPLLHEHWSPEEVGQWIAQHILGGQRGKGRRQPSF
jgi:hypothetical protein